MNGFQKHGLNHTSPSAFNMWAECPGAWAARYLFNKQFIFGVAPMIGILVEDVCARVLTKEATFEQALDMAQKEFNQKTALLVGKDRERIRDIEAMAALALKELEPYGRPEFDNDLTAGRKQKKIELLCKGENWELPVIGYLDFHYPEQGLLIDLKTTLRMPSVMSEPHKRQGAVYKKSMNNSETKFLYVTPKKAQFHTIENENDLLADIKTILTRQEKILGLHDAETLRQILPVNTASYFWNGCEHISKELYGL